MPVRARWALNRLHVQSSCGGNRRLPTFGPVLPHSDYDRLACRAKDRKLRIQLLNEPANERLRSVAGIAGGVARELATRCAASRSARAFAPANSPSLPQTQLHPATMHDVHEEHPLERRKLASEATRRTDSRKLRHAHQRVATGETLLIGRTSRTAMPFLCLLLSGCGALDRGFLFPGGPVADATRHEFLMVCLVMLSVIGPVLVLTPLIAWHYRLSNTRSAYRPQWGFSWSLEGLIWVPPALIVIGLGVFPMARHPPARPL